MRLLVPRTITSPSVRHQAKVILFLFEALPCLVDAMAKAMVDELLVPAILPWASANEYVWNVLKSAFGLMFAVTCLVLPLEAQPAAPAISIATAVTRKKEFIIVFLPAIA